MQRIRRFRREAVIAGLGLAVTLAAVLAYGGSARTFQAHRNVVQVTCRAGFAAEGDGACSRVGGVEGPIESFTSAEQRATKQTAPFQTVAPGAYANAMAQRAKKSKTGSSWQPIGNSPLWANSP